jgi:hypothetical protein
MAAITIEGTDVICLKHGRHCLLGSYNGDPRIRHEAGDACDSQRYARRVTTQVDRDTAIYLLASDKDEFRRLIGKLVSVTYNLKKEVATGKLLGYGTDGQFVILEQPDGSVFFGWPMLHVEEVTDEYR